MILIELMFGMMLAAVVLLLIPVLLLMAGVAGVVLLWVLAPTALLIGLALWLLFPHAIGGAALLVLAVIAVLMLERRSHRMAIRRGTDLPDQFNAFIVSCCSVLRRSRSYSARTASLPYRRSSRRTAKCPRATSWK